MAFLDERIRQAIRDRLKAMDQPVKLINFTQELECEFCHETRRLLEEIAPLSDKLNLVVYNLQLDRDKVAQYKIDKIPATVVEGAKDYGLRFYGIPTGYEFSTLLDAILDASRGKSDLAPGTLAQLRAVEQPLHIQVFVTPT